ncbi:hypothetical protein K491DRAFT_691472 [Lophiostoma macrostomum CBS 122681]|uniref:Uncharacterized protein n=1 Tax=Lophiostoma macrostomum CBS 122681 TaxID=1314788 RepID=A0A6A6TBF0_9PLEO|nr:hypothetical protein K491DRAFT_691472 [Lophiostoma macrostomum CBS 122681]
MPWVPSVVEAAGSLDAQQPSPRCPADRPTTGHATTSLSRMKKKEQARVRCAI